MAKFGEYEEKIMPVAKLKSNLTPKAEILARMEKLDTKKPAFKGDAVFLYHFN